MPKIILVNVASYAQGQASFDLAMELYEARGIERTIEGELDGCPYCVYWQSIYHVGYEVLNIVVEWGSPPSKE